MVQDKAKTLVDDRVVDRIQTAIHTLASVEVDNEVARLSLEFFPMIQNRVTAATTYLDAALVKASIFRPLNGQLCTPQHLGWKFVRQQHSPFLLLRCFVPLNARRDLGPCVSSFC